ncbi:MAG: hypothetical protein ACK55I_03105, partial [bacterium]
RLGGWGDDDDHAEEEDVDEYDGRSGVGVRVGVGGGRGGGARKNNMTHDQSSFFPSGYPSITNSRLSRPGDERKMTSTGEEDGKSEAEKEDRTGKGVMIAFYRTTTTIAAVSSAGCPAPLHLRLIPHLSF